MVLAVGIFPSNVAFAASTKTQPLKVVGMARFVVKGSVKSIKGNSITIHITSTTGNAKQFDNMDKSMSIDSKTVITKNGKKVALKQFKAGDEVKVFGVFNKKTNSITIVRWIKAVAK